VLSHRADLVDALYANAPGVVLATRR
jgi:hypothetical protein